MKLIDELKKYGIEKVVEKYNLILKEDGDLFLLKYSQTKSNLKKQSVKEARGIIIEKNTFNVISLPFVRFTNHSDLHADKIDWESARIQTKLDGSIIQLYFYNGWRIGTSGTINGDGNIRDTEMTFSELFTNIVGEKFTEKLNKDYNYIFELTTNKHTIVTKFNDDNVTLLTIRDTKKVHNNFYGELNRKEIVDIGKSLNVDIIDEHNFNTLESVLEHFKELSFQDEGFVIVDVNFNRIKVKNPSWNAAHHNSGNTLNESKLISIVKSNEIIEFVEAYPLTKNKLNTLKVNYDKLINFLKLISLEKNDLTGKELATLIHKHLEHEKMNKNIVGLTFSFINSDIKDVYDFINNIPNKKLLKYIS